MFIAPDDSNADWQPATLNYPVTIGDSVWAGQDSRAEIDFGAGHVRLSQETNIHFSRLDDRQFAAYLASGRAILRLRALEAGEFAKFDTANVQVDILRPGTYRIEAEADGLGSVVVVRDGEAELRTLDSSLRIYSGQTATISGTGPGSSIVVRDGYGTDGFDAWSSDRDRRYEGGSVSTQYISSHVPGVRDLDYYGTWETVPTYGAIWYPTSVAVDWVPYRDGSWTYVRPWGWTWVDHAPWGWTPFHYGRWVRIGPRWAWCPGEFVRRPIYSPALVAWYGGPSGTNWSVSVGGPTFGWVPLAWGEAYYPHHRHSSNYWRVINRPYAVNVQRVPSKPLPVGHANVRALTAVSGEVFTGRAPVAPNHRAIPLAALSGTALTTTPIAARPISKPLPVDARPRGAPAPASAFVGRNLVDRTELNAGTGSVLTGRPTGPTPASATRPGYTPSVGGGRAVIPEPSPGLRPSVGAPPAGRASEPQPGRPLPREPAPVTGAPMQVPGQIYMPGQTQSPAPRPGLSPRSVVTEPTPPAQRPMFREPGVQGVPGPSQGQTFVAPPVTTPQSIQRQQLSAPQRAPAAQILPGPPSQQPAPMIREPMRAAPIPAPAQSQRSVAAPIPASGPQTQRPAAPNSGGARPEPPMPTPGPGGLPR